MTGSNSHKQTKPQPMVEALMKCLILCVRTSETNTTNIVLKFNTIVCKCKID